jgi:hypothetical protein
MRSGALLYVSCLLAACGAAAKPDAKPPQLEEAEAQPDPSAEPLFMAAKRICRLVDHRDDGLLAVAFAAGFFDATPPTKLDQAFKDIRDGLGRCGERMRVIDRVSALEGTVAVECENGVLLLAIGLDAAPSKPMLTLGLDLRPTSTISDIVKERAARAAAAQPSPAAH